MAAHLSERIAALTAEAGRLESVARDRSTTASALVHAELERDGVSGRLVDNSVRDPLKKLRASLSEAKLMLAPLIGGAPEGDKLGAEALASERRLAAIAGRDHAVSALRKAVSDIAAEMGEVPLGEADAIGDVLSRLAPTVAQREASLAGKLENRRKASVTLVTLQGIETKLGAARSSTEKQERFIDQLQTAKDEADRRIEIAKALIRTVNEIRSSIVRKVFDERLNAVWRELFIRLAPEEPFVPAFEMPSKIGTVMEAKLGTIYRRGEKGGNPKAVLSAGNLNTAALTLFLALNLSVKAEKRRAVLNTRVRSPAACDIHAGSEAASPPPRLMTLTCLLCSGTRNFVPW